MTRYGTKGLEKILFFDKKTPGKRFSPAGVHIPRYNTNRKNQPEAPVFTGKLGAEFQKDPVSVVEKLLGVDLPNEQLNQLVEGIKAKINLDQLGSKLGGLFGKR